LGFEASVIVLFNPERSVRHIKLTHSAHESEVELGVWHLIPRNLVVKKLTPKNSSTVNVQNVINREYMEFFEPTDEAAYDEALSRCSRVVLYLHGNAHNRARQHRIDVYKAILDHVENAHVITFDYRGFGDSTGTPSEDGVVADARAVFDWIHKRGKEVI
jgi:abhydrolase domain-containing protein 12